MGEKNGVTSKHEDIEIRAAPTPHMQVSFLLNLTISLLKSCYHINILHVGLQNVNHTNGNFWLKAPFGPT